MAKQVVPEFAMRHRMELALEYGNISVQEMAAELGMSRTTISNWLHGRTEPRRRDLLVWSMTCGVPLEWLMTGAVPAAVAVEPDTPKKRTRPSGMIPGHAKNPSTSAGSGGSSRSGG
jgi:transcriptional regulator with XRE-family HTH domain